MLLTTCAPSAYERNWTPEPCRIVAHVKRRTGKKKWWCETHQCAAWGPDGARLERCFLADAPQVAPEDILDLNLDAYPGGVAFWGALAPAYDSSRLGYERGIHVHARLLPGGPKAIDRTYSEVRVYGGALGSNRIVIRFEEA